MPGDHRPLHRADLEIAVRQGLLFQQLRLRAPFESDLEALRLKWAGYVRRLQRAQLPLSDRGGPHLFTASALTDFFVRAASASEVEFPRRSREQEAERVRRVDVMCERLKAYASRHWPEDLLPAKDDKRGWEVYERIEGRLAAWVREAVLTPGTRTRCSRRLWTRTYPQDVKRFCATWRIDALWPAVVESHFHHVGLAADEYNVPMFAMSRPWELSPIRKTVQLPDGSPLDFEWRGIGPHNGFPQVMAAGAEHLGRRMTVREQRAILAQLGRQLREIDEERTGEGWSRVSYAELALGAGRLAQKLIDPKRRWEDIAASDPARVHRNHVARSAHAFADSIGVALPKTRGSRVSTVNPTAW